MDRGEIFRSGFTVTPGEEGSFVLHKGADDGNRGFVSKVWGFSTVGALLDWLQKQCVDEETRRANIGGPLKIEID